MDIEEFIKDRNEAFLSLDESKIRAFMFKYKVKILDPDVFWISVHKAITACADLSLEFRKQSKHWLTDRNYDSLDDGDL